MPTTPLTNASQFTSVTLTQDELWQARGGSLLTTVEPVVGLDQGIELEPGEVRAFKAGQTVSYRPQHLRLGDSMVLVREAL